MTPNPCVGNSNGSGPSPYGLLPHTRRYASPSMSERRDPVGNYPPAPSVASMECSVPLTPPQHPAYPVDSSSHRTMLTRQTCPQFPAGERIQMYGYSNAGVARSRSATPTSRAQKPLLATGKLAGNPENASRMAIGGENGTK